MPLPKVTVRATCHKVELYVDKDNKKVYAFKFALSEPGSGVFTVHDSDARAYDPGKDYALGLTPIN